MAREKLLPSGFTRRQDAFIREYVRNGGNGTQAAKEAGYGEVSAYARAWELLQRADIIQAIQDETRRYVKTLGAGALGVLRELSLNACNETVRYQAASDLANRAGTKLPDKVEYTHTYNSEEVDNRIAVLIEELGPAALQDIDTLH